MKIYDSHHFAPTEATFNFDVVDGKGIDPSDGCFSIPFDLSKQSHELQDKVQTLASIVGNLQFWVYLDYKNISASLFVLIEFNKISASISIDVKPPVYTEKAKAEILQDADKTKGEYDDISEFENWQNIFEDANDFHANNSPSADGMFNIELTRDEERELMLLLLQELH